MNLDTISFADFYINPTENFNQLVALENHARTSAFNTRRMIELSGPLKIGAGKRAFYIPRTHPHYEMIIEILSHWAQCQIAIAHVYAERRSSLVSK